MKTINQYISETERLSSLDDYITEKFKISSKNINKIKYHPTDKQELKELIENLIKERGLEADLNDIDTSEITDMSSLFNKYFISHSNILINNLYKFNGDISKWNTSKVKNMRQMFELSEYTGEHGDISEWDVSKVENMLHMFYKSKYNGDLSKWDDKSVKRNWYMFKESPLEKNPPKWFHDKFN